MLRRIFGPKRDDVTGGWRKLFNEELQDLPSKIRIINARRMRWAEYLTRIREKRNVYRILAEMPEGKRQLSKTRCRWVDNIKMDPVEIG
jgi:hypothetical protein